MPWAAAFLSEALENNRGDGGGPAAPESVPGSLFPKRRHSHAGSASLVTLAHSNGSLGIGHFGRMGGQAGGRAALCFQEGGVEYF